MRGLAVGRIVKKSDGGINLALNAGMSEEDVTRQVVDVVNIEHIVARNKLIKKVGKAEKAMCDWINKNSIEDVYTILADQSVEFKDLLYARDQLVKKLEAEK